MRIALVVLYTVALVNLLYEAHTHGEPRGNHNFWLFLVGTVLELLLIWWAVGWKFI